MVVTINQARHDPCYSKRFGGLSTDGISKDKLGKVNNYKKIENPKSRKDHLPTIQERYEQVWRSNLIGGV
jgi:hypothetical protein